MNSQSITSIKFFNSNSPIASFHSKSKILPVAIFIIFSLGLVMSGLGMGAYLAESLNSLSQTIMISIGTSTAGICLIPVIYFIKQRFFFKKDENSLKINSESITDTSLTKSSVIKWEDLIVDFRYEKEKLDLIELLNKSEIKLCPYSKIYILPCYNNRPVSVFNQEGPLWDYRKEIEESAEEFKALILYWRADKKFKRHLLIKKLIFCYVDHPDKYIKKIQEAYFNGSSTTLFGKINPKLKAIIQGENVM